MKQHKFGKSSYRRLEGVNEKGIILAELALTLSPVDFGIAYDGGYRTAEKQNELFKAGKSTCDGYNKISKHQTGNAIDVIAYVNNKYTYEEHYYFMIITAFKIAAGILEMKVISGANWDDDEEYLTDQKFQDICHLQF